MEHVNERRRYTEKQVSEIRNDLKQVLASSTEKEKLTIVATGSYGRQEASRESDIDLFILFDSDDSAEDRIQAELKNIGSVIRKKAPNAVGDTGTFGPDAVVSFADMKINLGGQDDSNTSLTRRMLFLLEGTWLYQESRFRDYQRSLLQRYIGNSSPDAKLPRFLLNDVIRFYRTMATDFEHKVSEKGKEWGLRNIKLRFSRKLLYFGGILTIAEMASAERVQWEQKALTLFSTPVLQRIKELVEGDCGDQALATYDRFLGAIADPETRDALKRVSKEHRKESEEYQQLRKLSEEFSKALLECLRSRYDKSHPIHEALVF